MPNRIIKDGINESRALTSCSFFSQELYKRLITYADDYGRFNADPEIMLARLYPRELTVVTLDDLMEGLIELAGVQKISFYTAKPRDEVYGAFPKWGEHQRLRDGKKKIPDPDDTEVNDWYLRRFIPMDMKIQIIERDEFKCKICGKHIAEIEDAKRLAKMGAGLFHIDHIVPCQQGGRATMENLQLTCPKCNLKRQRMFTYEEILQFAKENANSPQLAATRRNSPPESNPIQYESTTRACEEAEPFLSDEEAMTIQAEQNEVLDSAKQAGFPTTTKAMNTLIRLYTEHGKETLMFAIDECVRYNKLNFAYMEKVCKNHGLEGSQPSQDDRGLEEWD